MHKIKLNSLATLQIFTLLLNLVYPVIAAMIFTEPKSLSILWSTSFQPVFILANILAAMFLFRRTNWKVPGIFLILLTVFSVDYYLHLHTYLAACFFTSCGVALYRDTKHYELPTVWVILYMLTFFLLIIPFSGLTIFNYYWSEVYAVYIICIYHYSRNKSA